MAALATWSYNPANQWPDIGVNCQLLFHLLGGSRVVDIFRTHTFIDVLNHCHTSIGNAGADDFFDADPGRRNSIRVNLTALIRRLDQGGYANVTLEQLIRGDVTVDEPTERACVPLKRQGCFLVFNHIPGGTHHRARSLIDNYGFLNTNNAGPSDQADADEAYPGDWRLKVFLTKPARIGGRTPRRSMHAVVATKAKDAGVLRVLANPFQAGETVRTPRIVLRAEAESNGYCCQNGTCQQVTVGDPDDFYCELDETGTSCNSLSDPCL